MSDRDFESHSSITTYCTCPRKYEYKYVLGREPQAVSEDLRMGKAWSEYLETGTVPENAPLSARALATLRFLAVGYEGTYGRENIKREVDLEHRGIRGRLDGLADGYIVESKLTRSRIDHEYWEQKRIDQQIMAYLYMAQRCGHAVGHVVYDVVKRPMIRPRRGETETQFFTRLDGYIYENRHEVYQRREYRWTSDELAENFENMLGVVGTMPVLGDHFPQYKNNCRAYGRLCEYFPVCSSDATLEDEELYTIRTRA